MTIVSMDDSKTASLEKIRAFLAGSGEVQFMRSSVLRSAAVRACGRH
jgi:hypothetical protein